MSLDTMENLVIRLDTKFGQIDAALDAKLGPPVDATTFDPTLINLAAGLLEYNAYTQAAAITLALDPAYSPLSGGTVSVNIVGGGYALNFASPFVGTGGMTSGVTLEDGISYPLALRFAPDWEEVAPGVFEDRVLVSVDRGGLGGIPTAVKTSAYQIIASDIVRTNTSGGGFTVTAPSAPVDGAEFILEDAAEGGSWSLANPLLLVTSDGSTLAGNPGAAGVNHDGGTAALWRHNTTTTDWVYVGEAGGATNNPADVLLPDLGTSGTVAIDLSAVGLWQYPKLSATGVVTFTIAASPVDGASAIVPFNGNGDQPLFASDIFAFGFNTEPIAGLSYDLASGERYLIFRRVAGVTTVEPYPHQAAEIANSAITYGKMQDVSASSRALGRGSAAGSGPVQELSFGAGLQVVGTEISATGGGVNSFDHTSDFGAARAGELDRALIDHIQDIVNVKDFGAVGDDSTSDTSAVSAAIAFVNSINAQGSGTQYSSSGGRYTLYFPPGRYRCSSLTNLEAGINVRMHGTIVYSGSTYNAPFWTIGGDTVNNQKIYLELRLYGSGSNPFTSEDFVGVRLFNLNQSQGYISSNLFTVAVQWMTRSSTATTLHSSGNDFWFGTCKSKVGIDVWLDHVAGQATCWMTANTFRGGTFMGNDVPSSIHQYGIRFQRTLNATNSCHSFRFYDMVMEPATGDAGIDRSAFLFDQTNGGYGWIYGERFYNETLKAFVHFKGNASAGGGTRFSAIRHSTSLTTTELDVYQPDATAGQKAQLDVIGLAHGVEKTFASTNFTVKHWMFHIPLTYTGTGGHTVTMSDSSGEGELTIINNGTGPLNLASDGTNVQTGSNVTQITAGQTAKIRSYARATKHRIVVTGAFTEMLGLVGIIQSYAAAHAHNASGAVAPSLQSGIVGAIRVTLAANGTSWAPTNVPTTTTSRYPVTVRFIQGAAGSFTLDLSALDWGNAGAPTLGATAGDWLEVVMTYDHGVLYPRYVDHRTA